MKALVVFYSRTGTTKKVAQDISKLLKADIEEIIDLKKRRGILGYIKSGKDAAFKKITKIKPIERDSSKYDIVIIGTPVWAGTMSSAIRTYISENKDKFNRVVFFCTMSGSGYQSTFNHMKNLCRKKPLALIALKTKIVRKDNYLKRIKSFIEAIKTQKTYI